MFDVAETMNEHLRVKTRVRVRRKREEFVIREAVVRSDRIDIEKVAHFTA